MKKLGADFGYTLDGPELGSFEEETFSADGMKFIFHGVSAHPGHAKDKLVNAIKMAAAFIDELPKDEFSPETTEDRYGFVHPVRMEGSAEKMQVEFIIRDFNTAKLAAYEDYLVDKANDAMRLVPGGRFEFEVKEQYRNMKEVLNLHPQVSDLCPGSDPPGWYRFKRDGSQGWNRRVPLIIYGIALSEYIYG